VLFSALAKLAAEPARKREAVLRSMRQSILVAAPMSVGLAVTFPAIELLIWHGKWAAAAGAVQAFGVLYVVMVPQSIAHVAQQARGEFRAAALGLTGLALIAVAAAAWGALAFSEPMWIALALGLGRAVGSAGYMVFALRPMGIGPVELVKANGPAWGLSLLAGGLAFQTDWLLIHYHPLVRLVAVCVVFGSAYAVLARLLLRSYLVDLVRTAPGRAGRLARLVLLLPAATPAAGLVPGGDAGLRCARCGRAVCACGRSDQEAGAASVRRSV
jgi:O-antigen/teichoic acid export membrane protein